MFDSNRTLKLIFVTLSLRVKELGFRKKWEFKEEDDDMVNKVVLTIVVKRHLKKKKKYLFKFKEDDES